jgi:hypothetical protein
MSTTTKPKRGRKPDGIERETVSLLVHKDAAQEFRRQAKAKGILQAWHFNNVFKPIQ